MLHLIISQENEREFAYLSSVKSYDCSASDNLYTFMVVIILSMSNAKSILTIRPELNNKNN